MKKIKLLITTVSAFAIFFVLPSCKKSFSEFLDKAPGVDVNENTIFSSKAQLDIFLLTIYKFSLPSHYNYGDGTTSTTYALPNANNPQHPTASITDEGDASEQDFITSNVWNAGNILATNIVDSEDRWYYQRFVALRQIALMLKRVDEVPDADAVYKTQVKAEVKVLRALLYLEMVKRYGGVAIVDKVFDPGANINELVPRASIEDVFKFIVSNCDEAAQGTNLPNTYSSTQAGRVTRLCALAVKAKALLYAASPLFNTATPYLDFGANNKLICYGNYDINRWKLAADAAKAVIDAAPASNIQLIDVPANRDPVVTYNVAGPYGNYSNSWEVLGNSEIILQFQGYGPNTLSNKPLVFITPGCYGAYWSGISVPLNFIQKYEKKADGTPQTWSAAGGTDLIAKYNELDPRFKQTINYTTSYFNPSNAISSIYTGGAAIVKNPAGNWCHKGIPRASTPSVPLNVNDIAFRLNEFYLDYAEAQNEFEGPGTQTPLTLPVNYATAQITTINSPLDAVNKIRLRSAMPPISTTSKDVLRDRIRNEWTVEMSYEEHRFWNIRRWMIAEQEGVMQGAMQGLKINLVGSLPVTAASKFTWLPYTFETRIWYRKEYLHPFPQSEVLKGGLTQNPGWQ